jgi:hypothetical protein
MIIQEGNERAEFRHLNGCAIFPEELEQKPQGQPPICLLQANQLCKLAISRVQRAQDVHDRNWLFIYAEKYARRHHRVDREAISSIALNCFVTFTLVDLDEACANAERALKRSPDRSVYSVKKIGEMLQVTIKERLGGLTHLGCCEETNEQRDLRRKAERKLRDAKRRKGLLPGRPAPWLEQGISRATWYRLKRIKRLDAESETPIIYKVEEIPSCMDLSSSISITGVSPETQPQASQPEARPQAKPKSNFRKLLEAYFGPPWEGEWPKPPPIVGKMQATEAPDGCSTEVYGETDLDRAALVPSLRGFARTWVFPLRNAGLSGAPLGAHGGNAAWGRPREARQGGIYERE